MRKRSCLFLAVLGLAGVARAGDEDLDKRIRELEEQNRQILERLKESEQKSGHLEGEVDRLRSRESELLEREIEDYIDTSRELEGGEPAGMRTKKEAFLTIYGFLRMDVYYNTARADNVVIPFRVIAEDGVAAGNNDDQFAMDPRLTRLGFDFNLGKVMEAAATGKLETDFANFPAGVSESRATPRIRLAYFQLESGKWWLRMGQDWDVASPLFPTANNETLMWNAGNPGDRRPQIRWFCKCGGAVTVDMAIGLSGAVSNQDLDAGAPPFTSTERDGFDAGWPNYQVRAAWTSSGERKIVVGIWGYIGGIETDTAFGGETDFLSWMGGLDFTVPMGAKLILRGEVWFAQAAGDIRANAGQTINTATGEEIDGLGGWIELRFLQSEKWNWHVGGTIDDPDDSNLPAAGIDANFTIYVGVIRHWTKTFRTGFDVIYWETQYANDTLGNMLRFDFYGQFDF
jgi:hypothetical protein